MDIPYLEPLLIYSEAGEWTHPEINKISEGLEKMDGCDNLQGNLIRINIEMESNTFYLIAITDDKGMNEITSDKINLYMKSLFILLAEDIWLPGGEQFVSSEYGQQFNNTYALFDGKWNFTVSPDVSLNHDETEWWFDT